MTVQIANPLPECSLCAVPTKRDVHELNGGLCTACMVESTLRMVPVRSADADDLDDLRRRREDRQEQLDLTAYVDRWLPPVPGKPGEGPADV